MKNLPRDLVEEVLSRVPVTSRRIVRSTCKKWTTLFEDESFTKKHLAQQASSEGEFLAIAVMNHKLYLMSVNLQNNSDPYVNSTSILITLNDSDQLDMSQICHCDGLFLCTTLDYTRLVVWNPYTGQNRWLCIDSKSCCCYALGHDKSKTSYKILRYDVNPDPDATYVHKICDVNSNSWRVLDVTPDWYIAFINYNVSLNGNTYWIAHNWEYASEFVLCFDFTTERFGPRLPLPFESNDNNYVALSSTVRDEQLALLFQPHGTNEIAVWVTTKIEPNAVSWSKFLSVVMNPITGFWYNVRSFIVDKKRRAVIVFFEDRKSVLCIGHIACFIGENAYYREMDLGKRIRGHNNWFARGFYPLACSYVPSSMQINQAA